MVVCWGRAQCCVDADTVLCLRLMPVMHRHQLALCESEKEGTLCEVEAPLCWYGLSLSRPICYLHEVPLVTTAGLVVNCTSPLKTASEVAHAATAVFQGYRTAWWQLLHLCQITA